MIYVCFSLCRHYITVAVVKVNNTFQILRVALGLVTLMFTDIDYSKYANSPHFLRVEMYAYLGTMSIVPVRLFTPNILLLLLKLEISAIFRLE